MRALYCSLKFTTFFDTEHDNESQKGGGEKKSMEVEGIKQIKSDKSVLIGKVTARKPDLKFVWN
jgi:hypothetical protein